MSNESEYDWAMHDDRVRAHYAHAIEKHPYFCDWIGTKNDEMKTKITKRLEELRMTCSAAIKRHDLGWDNLLDCEMWEVFEALASGDTAEAVKHLYEMIAKILRTIDVLEGRQKLGKPETKGETK